MSENILAEDFARAVRIPPPLRLTPESVAEAADAWNFNCGPAALCAVAGVTPDEVRAHLGDFEHKGYTNPTLMRSALVSLWRARKIPGWQPLKGSPVDRTKSPRWPDFGLARIQWDGPWCKEGVPVRARYRQTHWVASCYLNGSYGVFDINAIDSGGWIRRRDWQDTIVPHILKHCVPRATGGWWVTHSIEITEMRGG